MKVHGKMKNGYAEAIYQKCLAIELKKAGLNFQQEVEVAIYYDGVVMGKRRVDFIIEEKIIVELKAISNLENDHLAQALDYLEANKLEIGPLFNFGSKSLQFKRLINQQKLSHSKNPANPINP
jgi:GxxExxY protein